MIVGFTGTQEGMTRAQLVRLARVLARLDATEFHHGGCIGADTQAAEVAASLDVHPIVMYPSNLPGKQGKGAWDRIRPAKLPLERNHDIVDACELLIACPRSETEERRSGTWATVRYARQLDIPILSNQPGR